jgi:hypothetical protein
MQALGLLLLDIDSLDIAVQLFLSALLVVSFSTNAHAQSEGDALDAALPDLLVQLWVKADVAGSLSERERQVSERLTMTGSAHEERFNGTHKLATSLIVRQMTYHRQLGELLNLLDCSWSTLLERYAMNLRVCKILDQSSVQYSCI